jgi:uncharacterized RDD family membrane protein YckC
MARIKSLLPFVVASLGFVYISAFVLIAIVSNIEQVQVEFYKQSPEILENLLSRILAPTSVTLLLIFFGHFILATVYALSWMLTFYAASEGKKIAKQEDEGL